MGDEIIEEQEPPKFSGKLQTLLPNGRIIYDGVEGTPSDFPLTEAEILEATSEQLPIDPPTPEELAAEAAQKALIAAKAEAQADNIVQYLRDHTPAECARYVQDNVTDLASAKAFLKKVAIVLCVLSKESLR